MFFLESFSGRVEDSWDHWQFPQVRAERVRAIKSGSFRAFQELCLILPLIYRFHKKANQGPC